MPDVHAVMRPAQPEDAAGIQALFTDEEESFRVYPEGQFPLTVDQVERLIKKRTEPTVLEIDGRIAGFSGLYSYKEGSSAFIGNVIIDRQFRGRGLGKQLMEYMIDRGFRAHGLQQLRIAVFNDNTSALLLYASLGFAPYRVKKREGYQGRTYGLVSMKLLNNLTP